MKVWAFIDERGEILADSRFGSADTAWRVGLGWPCQEEIDDALRRGCRVEQVEIVIGGGE